MWCEARFGERERGHEAVTFTKAAALEQDDKSPFSIAASVAEYMQES